MNKKSKTAKETIISYLNRCIHPASTERVINAATNKNAKTKPKKFTSETIKRELRYLKENGVVLNGPKLKGPNGGIQSTWSLSYR